MKHSLAALALVSVGFAEPLLQPLRAQPGQAVVIAERVNVRSRPALAGEVVAKLDRGRTVTVIEEGLTSQEAGGQFLEWTRIALPEGARAWAAGRFVDAETSTVKATRLNVRAGPGEDFGVLGTLTNGTAIRVLGETNGWLELAPPAGLSAFVAAQFLEMRADQGEATRKPESPESAAPPPTSPVDAPTTNAVPPAPAPDANAAPDVPPPTEPVPDDGRDQTASAGGAPPAPDVADRRIVRREGVVRRTLSIQAPTDFELRALDTGRRLNYLLPASAGVQVRPFHGTRVVVTGEEQFDQRWPITPMIVAEQIELAP